MSFRKPVILLGHSFGATTATAIAAHSPDLVSDVVLLSPVVRRVMDQAGLGSRAMLAVSNWYCSAIMTWPSPIAELLCQSKIPGHVSNILLVRRGMRGALQIYRFSKEKRTLPFDRESVSKHLLAACDYGGLDFAGDVRAGSVVIAGDRDPLASGDDLERLAANLRSEALIMIRGAGHLAHHEDHGAVQDALLLGLEHIRGATVSGTVPQRSSKNRHCELAPL